MSEQPTATASQPKPKPGAGKKYAGLTKQQLYIVGGVFVAALIYIVWKRRQSAAAASTGQAATNQGSNECTDANGNPVDCNEAFAQELADMANALDQLQAQQGSGAGGSGVSGTVGTVPATTPDTVSGAPATTQPSGTPTTSGGSTATKAPPAAKPGPPPTPGNVHATKVTASSITVAWNKVTGATGYRIRVTYQSKLVTQQSTSGTTATISGLGADHTYGIHVASVGPGGTGPEGDVQIKTSK